LLEITMSQSRRRFISRAAAGTGLLTTSGLTGILRAQQPPAAIGSEPPLTEQGLQIGDVVGDRAIIWSRADRPSRMLVEWSTTPSFHKSVRVRGPHALEVTGYTARVDLSELPPDREVFVRVKFESLDPRPSVSAPLVGKFRTAPREARDVRLVFSGDTAGQGWGINPAFGGMKLYKTMQDQDPDFFIHSGDNVYADGPMLPSVTLPDGSVWTNAFLDQVPAKLGVAQTLQDFRDCYRYNLCDPTLREFNASVAQVWQWDDHETLNNWSDSKDLGGNPLYTTEKRIRTLASRSTRAFLEYSPMRWHDARESERIYRQIPYGPDLDVFMLDERSYRGPNSTNLQPQPGDDTAFLGRKQIDWLKRQLTRSRATWKVIASDMPIGLLVGDGTDAQGKPVWEAVAQGDGPVLGREFELAEILSFIKRERIRNTVWITADVHYCAAHHYHPDRAQFTDFEPFWEFVAGPANAGTFGPNGLDNTFGPELVFQKVPPAGQSNLAPSAGYQFFGQMDIDPRQKDLVVALKDINGNTLFSQHLEPHQRGR
jgi:alkaline phosphatase D